MRGPAIIPRSPGTAAPELLLDFRSPGPWARAQWWSRARWWGQGLDASIPPGHARQTLACKLRP